MIDDWEKLVALVHVHELKPGEVFCINCNDSLGVLWAAERLAELEILLSDERGAHKITLAELGEEVDCLAATNKELDASLAELEAKPSSEPTDKQLIEIRNQVGAESRFYPAIPLLRSIWKAMQAQQQVG